MNNHRIFAALTAWAAIASAPIAYATFVYGLRAVEWDFSTLVDPMASLYVGPDGAPLIRLSMVADMLGYYLPLIPVAIYLWQWLRKRQPGMATLYTVCALFYIVIGAIGASILAAAHPPLITEYATSTGVRRETVELLFRMTMDLVYGGMWNMLEMLLAGIWWTGIGLAIRAENRALGMMTIVIGVASLIDSIGTMVGSSAIAMIGLPVYILLAPLWAFSTGIAILRGFGAETAGVEPIPTTIGLDTMQPSTVRS
jgi:hypothetical protein